METITYIEKFVPEVYKESRDFRVLLKLLDMVYSIHKYDIDNWLKLYDAYNCPRDFLPLLADMVGYKYDNDFTFDESRVIIANFVNLLKNRGSKIGLKEALSVLLNAKLFSDIDNEDYKRMVNQLSLLEIYFNYETGRISLYFPQKVDYNKNFMNYIRPIGTYLNFIVTEFPEPESDIALITDVNVIKHKNFIKNVTTDSQTGEVISEDKTYLVDKAQVNLSQLGEFENDFDAVGTETDYTINKLDLNCYSHKGNYITHNNKKFNLDDVSTMQIKFSGSKNQNFVDKVISVNVTNLTENYKGFIYTGTIDGTGGATANVQVSLINDVEYLYVNEENNTINYIGRGSCITEVYCENKIYKYCEISLV